MANHFWISGSGAIGEVELQLGIGAVEAGIEMHLVVAALGVLQEHRQFCEIDEALHVVELAGDGAQIDDLGIFGERQLHLVDIGQLVARRYRPPRNTGLRSSTQVWLLIGCTMRHADSVGTSGLSRQSDLILKTCAQLSKPAALAFCVERLDGAVFRQELLEIMRRCIEAEFAFVRLQPRLAAADLRVAGELARRTGSADRRTRTARWFRRP